MDINKDFKKIKSAVVAIAKKSGKDYKVSTELKNGKTITVWKLTLWINGDFFFISQDIDYFPDKIRLATSFFDGAIFIDSNAIATMLWHFAKN